MPDSHAVPSEIEIKLLFGAEARSLIEASSVLREHATVSVTKRQITTYYDTAALFLSGKGFALRVREVDGRFVQTLKTQSSEDGSLFERGEWEWPISTDTPELARLKGTPAESLMSHLVGQLEPVWLSDVERTQHLVTHSGATVEVALDEGMVRAGQAEEPIRELELEIKSGSAAALHELALELVMSLPLRLGVETKAERGYRLRTDTLPASVHGKTPVLERKVSAAEGLQRILGSGLCTLVGNEPAARLGDVEGVHQMRVAVRRLRSALQLFTPRLEPHSSERFTLELQRLGRILGAARDWDVFVSETLPAAFPAGEGHEWHGLLAQAAEVRRRKAHETLKVELESSALTELVLSLMVWSEKQPFVKEDIAKKRLSDIAPDLLDRIWRKVYRRGHGIEELAEEDLHSLRKSLKKFRYAVDYLAGLYPSRQVKACLQQCKRLQQALGEINDMTVAAQLADELDVENVALAPAAGQLVAWSEQRRRKALKSLPAAWKELRDAPLFWR
ncbi:CHAD domain-containing protein [Acetobacter estunensis]|uniref:CYTH and CHAD domain-containing protein n=1 Tax=Acetobacter estunensis TaxID=104097 RepID=UPI001C2DEC65|nr:CHAD domain-containing protein [Acetobacter estunensis]MBV1837561.1 CHAD domain-containing protein [Acetobacter estunensis]